MVNLRSAAITRSVAGRLADQLRVGDLILFTGGIGSGKTTFIQGLATGLGIHENVTSPSYVLQAVYRSGRLPLSHVDLYRLDNADDVEGFGMEDYMDISVTVVEWADRYTHWLPPYAVIDMQLGVDENERILTVYGQGLDWPSRIHNIFAEFV